MLDVRRLRLLRDLDRLGTIAAVAAAHTYSPSAVSQQLAALEREAGVALLERSGRRVAFTPAGRVLVRHAETVLAALEEAGAALAAVRSGPAGPLRIGAFPSAVRTVLPFALVTLAREHPALELHVTELDPAEVPAALRERRLDAGLVHDYDIAPAAADDDLASAELFEENVYIAVPAVPAVPSFPAIPSAPSGSLVPSGSSVPPDSPAEPFLAASAGSPSPAILPATSPPSFAAATSVAELSDEPWILASPGTLCHEVTMRVCQAAGFTPRARHHADDFGAVLALVAAGQGASLVPQLAVDQPPAAHPTQPAPHLPPAARLTQPASHQPPSAHLTQLAPHQSPGARFTTQLAPHQPLPGFRLINAPTRRRTRVAFRRGAADHPAIAALVAALRAARSQVAQLVDPPAGL